MNVVTHPRTAMTEKHSKSSHIYSSNLDVLHWSCCQSTYPPVTPQIEYDSFQFSSKQNTINNTSLSEEEGLPLTPSDSVVGICFIILKTS